LKPFINQRRYERLARELREKKLTNFRLFSQAFFQILSRSLWRIGHPAPAKQIKEHSLFIGYGEEDKVTWEMGATFDLSNAFKEVNVELRVTLRPGIITGGFIPYVGDFVIWSQWILPKPRQKNAAKVINELFFHSYELPCVFAEAIDFIPTDEESLKIHIPYVAKQIKEIDSRLAKEEMNES
jgi:hypothetical protein